MSERPARPGSEHEGYEFVAVPEHAGHWRPVTGKKCRRMLDGHRYCRQPSVAETNRSGRPGGQNWWAYCADHLYGRWIEDGQVMHWILRKTGDPQ